MVEEKKLDRLKVEYEKIQKKHKLPSFKELNEDFWIEELAEDETDLLIRKVRIKVGDHLSRAVRFVEGLLNPTNAPMFVFSIVKMMDSEDKKKLSEMYKELVKSEVRLIKLDFEFNEEKEAQFIRNSYKIWQPIKKELLEIMEKIDLKWDDKAETNNKGYFG
ncbi:MAG: hypothetical protein AABX91_02870 [Nanoarchaeota archaeon]